MFARTLVRRFRSGPRRPVVAPAAAAFAIAAFAVALFVSVVVAAAEAPERIVSWRIRSYPVERYREIRDQWRDYTKEHPMDPLGWTQLARAARYAGDDCMETAAHARRALEVGPG